MNRRRAVETVVSFRDSFYYSRETCMTNFKIISHLLSHSLIFSSISRLVGHEGQILIPSYGAPLAKQQQQKMTYKWSTHYHLLKNTGLMPDM